MSIYSTWLSIDDENHTEKCAKWVRVKKAEAEAARSYMVTTANRYYRFDVDAACNCGELAPIVYQGSHVNPSDADKRGGFVMACAIPNHCHPDARGVVGDDGEKVWFLRLSVREDPETYQGGEAGDATVVLDRKQVTELHETLTAWLEVT